MTADTLRRAAASMRERAEAATAGPWESWQDAHAQAIVSEVGRRSFGVVAEPSRGPSDYGEANAGHIASWHPAVALAVADWLDAESKRAADYASSARAAALAVARAYLGESA